MPDFVLYYVKLAERSAAKLVPASAGNTVCKTRSTSQRTLASVESLTACLAGVLDIDDLSAELSAEATCPPERSEGGSEGGSTPAGQNAALRRAGPPLRTQADRWLPSTIKSQ